MILKLATGFATTLCCASVLAESPDEITSSAVLDYLEPLKVQSQQLASYLWENPELGYFEHDASAKLSELLSEAGFTIEKGVAGMPTAFVASYGDGEPVIALLGEMDALPGETQASTPYPETIAGTNGNHACGHNLLGPGSAIAAIAVARWLKESGQDGTIRYFAAPAEEGGAGKIYMVRAGLFDDVNIVLHWHPGSVNAAIPVTNNAVISGKFRFRGAASHAAVSPERGRSALDGVEAMNYMVNMMREHMPSTARAHYIISSGGDAPNIVPDYAEVYYYAREEDVSSLKALWQRIRQAANAAAMGTETEVELELVHGTYNTLVNHSLKRALDANLQERAPTLAWTDDERAFAKQIYDSIETHWRLWGSETQVLPFQELYVPGSSDVGDISWVVPTADVMTLAWVPSTDAHTWQAAAVGNTGIGFKGMQLASEVLAMTAVDLFSSPVLVAEATEEFKKRRGDNFVYESLVDDKPPPLDYRLEERKSVAR